MLSPKDAAALIVAAKAILFDWDGCLMTSGLPLPGATDMLIALSGKSYILSNNSTDLPEDLALFLGKLKIAVPIDNILLAGHQTLMREVARSTGRSIRLIAAPRMISHALKLGLNLVTADGERTANVETVIVMRDTGFNFRTLTSVANVARTCDRIVLSNPDATHPGPRGSIQPETGSLFAAILACLGDWMPKIEVIGKPAPALFDAALTHAGIDAADAVMIGDNPDTDGAGARALGIPFVHVQPDGPLTMASLAQAFCRAMARSSNDGVGQ